MANGGGILFGCFVCQYLIKDTLNPFIGKCGQHSIDTSMSFICNDIVFHEIDTGNMIYRWFLAFQHEEANRKALEQFKRQFSK